MIVRRRPPPRRRRCSLVLLSSPLLLLVLRSLLLHFVASLSCRSVKACGSYLRVHFKVSTSDRRRTRESDHAQRTSQSTLQRGDNDDDRGSARQSGSNSAARRDVDGAHWTTTIRDWTTGAVDVTCSCRRPISGIRGELRGDREGISTADDRRSAATHCWSMPPRRWLRAHMLVGGTDAVSDECVAYNSRPAGRGC